MTAEPFEHTTRLLRAVRDGTPAAAEELLPFVYEELRHIASRLLQRERSGHTLEATALIHEAWLKLAGEAADVWQGRVHFLRVAARAMRHVLVDHARNRVADKRGGGRRRVTLDTQLAEVADDAAQLLQVQDGLERLQAIDPWLAQVVEMKFFAGMTMDQIAAALDSSTRTVERAWRSARAWWLTELGEGGPRP